MIVDEKLYSASNLIEATEDSKVALNLIFTRCKTYVCQRKDTEKGRKKMIKECMYVWAKVFLNPGGINMKS